MCEPPGSFSDGLEDDPSALLHLVEAHEEAIVRVAVRARRDLEVVRVVAPVRLGLAHVVRDAGRAEARAGEPVRDRHLLRDGTAALRAVDEDPVALDQALHVGDHRGPMSAITLWRRSTQPSGDVHRDAADARVVHHHPRAGELFVEVVDLLAVVVEVPEVGERPEVDQVRPDADAVVDDARHLRRDHAERDAARRWRDAEHLLDRVAPRVRVVDGAHVVEPFGVRDHLLVEAILRLLLEPAVEVADLAARADDRLAVELHLEPERAVRDRMARPDVDDQLVGRDVLDVRAHGRGP